MRDEDHHRFGRAKPAGVAAAPAFHPGGGERRLRPGGALPGVGLILLSLLAGLSLGGARAEAAFPGPNGRLACDGDRGPAPPAGEPPFDFSRLEVYTMNPDGSGVRVLTANSVRDGDPELSPDGKRIVFESARDNSARELYTMNPDGTGAARLTFALGGNIRGSWAPDGARIAFQGGRNGNFDIYSIRADGSDPAGQILTTPPQPDVHPAWSPDGRKIAHRASRDGNGEIWTMSAELGELSGLRPLTSTEPPVGSSFPDWSPDGRKLVFQSNRDGVGDPTTTRDDNSEIYTMNADGSDLRRLTVNTENDPASEPNEALDDSPAFSPDGRRIVFESGRSGDVEVYTMNAADGSGVRRLTDSPGFDGRCDWGRVALAAKPPEGCVARGLRVRVEVAGAAAGLRTTAFVDGKRVASTGRASFTVRVPAKRLPRGRHRLTVRAIDAAGNGTRGTYRFRSCAARRPRFAG